MWYPDLTHDQAGGDGGRRSVTQMVVMHCTDNTASDEAESHYAEHRADGTSAHFYSDEDSVIQALDTQDIAWGCYPIGNARSIQFEMTGLSDQVTDATMRRVAPIVARVCADWSIPVRHVGPDELRAGAQGICGHGDVTRAWGQGDHTDPGDAFPWSTFIGYVQAAALPASSGSEVEAMHGSIVKGVAQCVPVPIVSGKQRFFSIGADFGHAHIRVAFGANSNRWQVYDQMWVGNDADCWTPELPADVTKISILFQDGDATAIGWTLLYV